jgi:hypothetical protein
MAKNNENTPRQNAFIVPDGYFENFESRMLQAIGDKKTPFRSIRKVRVIAPWVGLAAAFLIIAMIYTLIPKRIFPDEMQVQNESSLFEYSTADYFNEFELMELLTNENNTDYEIYPDSLFFRDINEEDIIMLTSLR